MKFKYVFRKAHNRNLFRLFRIIYKRGLGAGHGGNNYHVSVSLGLIPKLISFNKDIDEFMFTLFGFRVHYQRSYGGIPV